MVSPTTVLIIEDDGLVRDMLTAYLSDSGYRVIGAAGGRAGLELFERQSPAVVITDLRMPVMNGLEVMAVLREKSPSTPIIVMSGMGDGEIADEAFALGAVACIRKPINDMRELVLAIERALGEGG